MNKFTALSMAAVALMLTTSSILHAQLISETTPTPTATGTLPTDVKPGDWAYDAIQDCAAKGLIAGYPPDGNFLGNQPITRFEAATIVARLLAKLDTIETSGASTESIQSQIDEISKLTDDFKVELTVIGTNMDQAQADIKTLQDQMTTVQDGLGSAYDSIEEQAKRITALEPKVNASYGSTSSRNFSITGYIQFRAVEAEGGNYNNFPNGTNASQGAYNGFYAQGGSRDGLQVRRARIRFAGQVTPNTTYAAQLDFDGAQSTANQQVTVREAWGGYTFGDGSKGNPKLTAGLFALPFGYIMSASGSAPAYAGGWLSPERPLAFNEISSTDGPFINQDFDKGVKFDFSAANINFTLSAVNGAGRNSEDIDNHFDEILNATYAIPGLPFTATVGGAYYNGLAYATRPSTVAAPASYPEPKKQLADANVQLGYDNFFVNGEYLKGTYEELVGFGPTLAASLTPPTGNTTYVKGNIIQGYYYQAGYTFFSTTNNPLTLGMDYDVFQRDMSNPDYDDVNYGFGGTYNLDKATRLRLWYDDPLAVAHAPGTPYQARLGLATAELQVKF